MLLADFDVLGYWKDEIYFRHDGKTIMIKKTLPKEDLILKLKVEPEECKELKDAILYDACQKPLTHSQRKELLGETDD